jgi:hypothetical protein
MLVGLTLERVNLALGTKLKTNKGIRPKLTKISDFGDDFL